MNSFKLEKNFMKKIFAVLLILFGLQLRSQTLFHKFINDPYTYWVAAYSDNDEVTHISYDGFFTTFLKTNANADTLWSLRYGGYAQLPYSLFVPATNDTNYHIFGDSSKIYLSKTHLLSYLWTKSFRYDTLLFHPNLSELCFGTHLTDGKTAMVGKVVIPTGGGFGMDIAPVVTLTDIAGNIIWSRHYYAAGWCFHPQFIADNGNTLVLLGIICSVIAGQPNSTDALASMAIDRTTGNVIDNVHVYRVDVDIALNGISASGRYAVGYYFEPWGTVPGGRTLIARISENGAISWMKTINTVSHPAGAVNCITEVNSGRLLVGGSAMSLNNFGGTNDGQFFAATTDSLCDSVFWYTLFSDTAYSGELLSTGAAMLCKKLQDNNFLLWGTYTNSHGIGYAIRVNAANGLSACQSISLNATTMPVNTSDTTYTVVTQSGVFSDPQTENLADDIPEPPLGTLKISVLCQQNTPVEEHSFNARQTLYPNPADEKVTFCSSDINIGSTLRVIDAIGKVVFSGCFQAYCVDINTEAFQNGLYVIEATGCTPQKFLVIH